MSIRSRTGTKPTKRHIEFRVIAVDASGRTKLDSIYSTLKNAIYVGEEWHKHGANVSIMKIVKTKSHNELTYKQSLVKTLSHTPRFT